MKRVLLTGGSGILGQELQKTANNYGIEYVAPTSKELNILNIDKKWLDEKFDGIVHCAAYTDVPGAEINKKLAYDLNVRGTEAISGLAQMLAINMVYISTDYVYSKEKLGNHYEGDSVKPINYYGWSKYMGEQMVNLNRGDVIIRTSFKPNDPWKYDKAFDDLYTSADYIDTISPKINWLVDQSLVDGDAWGIFNVGTERKTIYELAKKRNKNVGRMSISDVKSVNLPKDASMCLYKFDDFYDRIENKE